MKNLLVLIFLFGCLISKAATYQVGSTKMYTSPNSLYLAGVVQDGDTIEIDAETYIGTSSLAVWQADNLFIIGVGGKPHLVANGQYIWGKGIWVFAGNNITVENIEFSGAVVPSHNGAGIRLDGVGMTVKNCYFHDNENGILTSNSYNGDILIEYSEFNNNGYGDGYSHNLYIGHVNKLTFRFNYSHHAHIGHNLKSRANENYVLYNRIMDEQTGDSSRLIDLPNGGFSIIMGNLLMQGNNAPNNNLFGYGLEGLTNTNSELYFINNTLVNKRTASCLFINIASGTTIANVTNNIFTGTGTILNGTTTSMSNNVIDPVITNLNFIDESNYDYHLMYSSSAIDTGVGVSVVNGYSLTPDFVYEHPMNFSSRILSSTIDAGAYEYNSTASVFETDTNELTLYPNPATNQIIIQSKHPIANVSIVNTNGQLIQTEILSNQILDISNLTTGIYFLKIATETGSLTKKFIKK